ncbi:hypothetical protein CEUSTIGMA_g8271.t1 [Chlamydomonas eustigma]|uniref:Protoporphyrinogen oxidase n=1 Tax=Chlamydomonas eustigma TaxID=1157962 RepID=A0A250XCQ3_9CHLO|nr:hypothetical protein CEUSTIGMA_g8271.t1 [Chlamydomonas eustigma]|eukprot:GAX80836.1 hypothetical protein CEUSTIGMA_g8271.t1 [Chlamydomonas eustigma]
MSLHQKNSSRVFQKERNLVAFGPRIRFSTPLHVSKNDNSDSSAKSSCQSSSSFTSAALSNRQTSRVVVARSSSGSQHVYDTVVVGAGISGLTTAQALAAKHGISNFLLTEARERVGGNITSMTADGYIWEEGPNSFQPNDFMLQIAVDAGVADRLVLGDPTAPRFVYWEKKLRATPSGPDILTFDLLSVIGKIRAGLGAVGILKAPAPGFEESVEQFIRRNLGDEVFERLIEPFCSGVYAGDPSKLSMKAAFGKIWSLESEGGSLVGGSIKRFQNKGPAEPRNPALPPKPKGQTVGSFDKGLRTLTDAIGSNVKDTIRVNWKLSSITKQEDGLYCLKYSTPEGTEEVQARTVALTVPAYTAADLLSEAAPAASEALRSFDYPPVAAVTLSYPKEAILDDRKDAAGNVPGFGQLHPRSQGVTTLGTIYSSSLFPGRCPDGQMLILNYIGGATNRGIVNQTHEEIVAQVDKDLRVMLIKDNAPAPKVIGVRVWPRAIPQFNIGHLDQLDKAKTALDQAGWDNFLLGGNYVSGVALGKAVEYGYGFAAVIAKRVGSISAPSKVPVSA